MSKCAFTAAQRPKIPSGNEEEPSSDADDDFAEETTAQMERTEHRGCTAAPPTPLLNLASRGSAPPALRPPPQTRPWIPWTSAVSWSDVSMVLASF